MRRLPVLLVVLVLLAAAGDSRPTRAMTSQDVLPFEATETTLANGLKVVVVPTGFPNIVSLRIPVQTGSRNEVEPGKSGFAHFFEHLMFRGTPAYPPEKYREIMVRAGARDNASTSDDFTRYFATFSSEDLEPMLALYADMFQHLSYPESDFRTEAGAILGEYNKNIANPALKLAEALREHAFTTHPYRHTTMGYLEDIEDMPNQYEYSKRFFQRWYRPEYTTVIVVGDVTPALVLELVEKYWGGWKPGSGERVAIPAEPAPKGPAYAHVTWRAPTLPLLTVAFRAPAFSDTRKDFAALELVASLYFGDTSDLYKRLVVDQQKVDQLLVDNPGNVDPGLFTVYARLKRAEDAISVRDEILKAAALARTAPVAARRLAEAKSSLRYSFSRTLDSTDRIAAVLAQFVPYDRSFQTVNNLFRVIDSLTPEDVLAGARACFTDAALVVATLSKDPLPAGIDTLPALSALTPAPAGTAAPEPAGPMLPPLPAGTPGAALPVSAMVAQRSPLPQLSVKLLFRAGSADDPAGREGLAALSAAMIADAGSRAMTIDEVRKALYPMAGAFTIQVDREMTTFTGSIHRDNWRPFLQIVLAQLLDSGFREADLARVRLAQRNALLQDLRSDNEEELGKERLQANIFAGTPYGHPVPGSVAGIDGITLDEVKAFVKARYTRANLMIGVNGDAPDEMRDTLRAALGGLPEGAAPAARRIEGRMPSGIEIEIIEKDTRSTAISFGHPIGVTRTHPDFAALSVARAWLGEHRASSGRLFQRLREVRGLNYGDYAYIEAFPRGMFQFFPDPNIARRAQIFEIWIRPVMPENAHMALRIAIHELDRLIAEGLSPDAFGQTRAYLMKNVYLMTSRQGQQLGYELDSRWFGIGEFTSVMRAALAGLTLEQVNAAVRKHLSAANLSVVMITKDAHALRERLIADGFSPITYEGPKPADVLEEDRMIGARKLGIAPGKAVVTPIDQVFAR